LELAKLKEAAKLGEGPTSLAQKRELSLKKQKAQENARERQKRDALTFASFWQNTYFPMAKAEKSKRSWKREDQFNRLWISPVIGNQPLKSISPIHLERIKSDMAKAGRAPRSIQYCFAVMRQVFNHARRIGLFQGDPPTAKVKVPKADNQRLRFLSIEEAQKLLVALKKVSPNMHDIALLSLHTGMRAGEIWKLTWADINWEAKTLTLKDTKSGRTRHALLTATAAKMLDRRRENSTPLIELVFPARGGKRRSQASQAFRRVVDKIGLNEGVKDARDKVVLHTLRHTYASWLVMQGTPLYTVQRLLGHQTPAMTQRYAHLAPDHLREAVNDLDKTAAGRDITHVFANEKT
jgi:integrase